MKLFERLRKKIADQKHYFQTKQDKLLYRSYEMTKYSSITTIILFLAFELYSIFCLGYVNWNPIFWAPATLIILFWPLVRWCIKKGYKRFALLVMPALLQICVMMYCIGIDVFPFPDKPDVFMSKILVAAPFLYYIPFAPQLIITTIGFICFLVMAYLYKTPGMFEIDAYSTFVSYVCGLLVSVISLNMRFDTQEAEVALDEEERVNRAKTTFLNNMSHDIRTPMNAIIGFTEMLEKNIGNPEKEQDCVRKIKSSSEFLLTLINNVLELSRIESGKTVLDESVTETTQFFDTILSSFEPKLREKNLTLIRKDQIKTRYIMADRLKLSEIFLNLVSNAVKYTPEGGTITLTAEEYPDSREGYVWIKTIVSDTGIGMSKEYLPQIFDDFTRERNTTESKVIGTGLGMPIVRKLVELMGGTIEVESQLGVGTTFIVQTKHKVVLESEVKKTIPEDSGKEAFDFKGKRILLAEDNELNAEIAIAILEDEGFEVDRAEDGIICVDRMDKHEAGYYDLILMDIQMPNMDGYKATSAIRKLPAEKSRIPIIAMTANAFEEDRKLAFANGMNGHLAKPIDVPKMLELLTEILSEQAE